MYFLLVSNQANKHTYIQTRLMKQTGKVRGHIFYGGFSSETECSERKKKDEETNQHGHGNLLTHSSLMVSIKTI